MKNVKFISKMWLQFQLLLTKTAQFLYILLRICVREKVGMPFYVVVLATKPLV